MKSYMAKQGEVEAKWYAVDATDRILGRMASDIAMILMGKNKPEYTPHVDVGDFVVVLNASKVRITGANKPTQRLYQRYSGYPGGRRVTTLAEMLEKDPCRVVSEAVRRMLPKNKLGVNMLKKLKVYADDKHEHQAQQPEPLEL